MFAGRLVLLSVSVTAAALAQEPPRECVLDRVVSVPADLARPVPSVAPLCDSLAGLQRREIEVTGGTLYAEEEEEGEGAPLVLISGGPGCTHHQFHPHFCAAADQARVIYYDQRGTGRSLHDPTGESYTIRQAVADLEAVRAALGLERWFVLGHSYGGFLAQCYALEHPGRVLGLVLVCASPGLPHARMLPTRQQEYIGAEERAAIASVWANGALTPEEQLFNKELAGDWKRQSFYRPTDEQAARMALYEWRPAPGFRERICPEMSALDLGGAFAEFAPPTLIIEARHDLTWNTDKPGIMQEAHPGCTLVMLERSGHSPFADEPDRFFAALRAFLADAAARPPMLPVEAPSVMPWPPPVVEAIERLPWTGAGDQAVGLLPEARRQGLTQPDAWFGLALRLYDGRHYEEALAAFAECSRGGPEAPGWAFAALTWQGMVLDLLGRREEALARYRQALGVPHPGTMTHSQYGLQLDQAWVEERLRTPFQRDEPAGPQ